MWARLASLGAVCVVLVISVGGCGSGKRETGRLLAAEARPPAAASGSSVSHRTFVLAVGWMPSGHGFEITARRFTWRARSYVALSASIVGRARSRAAIEHQAATGDYGSTQSNIGTPPIKVFPAGLVDCSTHPAVLLFAWTAPNVRAGVREDAATRTLRRAPVTAALGLPPGVVLYGPQTRAATLVQTNGVAEPLPAPPRHRTCRNGTESVMYAFGPRALSSSGTG